MNFSISSIEDITLIVVEVKRATMRDVEEFKNMILKEIDNGNVKILVDLSECEYIDSTFLGMLVVSLKMANKKGGTIKLIASNSVTQSMLDLTGAVKILPLYSSKEEAISNF